MTPDVLERVSDRVYRIEDRFVNLYLIDAARTALVDTGTRKAEPLLRAGLKELGKDVDDIGFILLTHHHLDHVGTAGIWQRETGASVGIHEADAPVIAGRERRRSKGVGLGAKVFVRFAGLYARLFPLAPLTPDRTFRDREVLDLPGLRVETIHAPGHTRGSCAFHLAPDDVLFAGDAVNGRQGRPSPPIAVEDAEAALASYAKLVSMDVPALLPGHGTPVLRKPR